jgi:hypothetical protein
MTETETQLIRLFTLRHRVFANHIHISGAMLSQADYVSSRPRQGQALPNTWGHLMAETSAALSVRFEDRDTQLTADDSALQRRAARMNSMSQKYNVAKPSQGADDGAAAASGLLRSAVNAVDVVDAWGYYHSGTRDGQHPSSDEEDAGATRALRGIGRAQRRGGRPADDAGAPRPPSVAPASSGALQWRETPPRHQQQPFQTPHNGPTPLASRGRGLLTPPAIFEHFHAAGAPREVPHAAMLTGGAGTSVVYPQRFGREVLPPPHMF